MVCLRCRACHGDGEGGRTLIGSKLVHRAVIRVHALGMHGEGGEAPL